MKLNIGCGPHYMDGWVNADACDLFRRDMALTLPVDKLVSRFGRNSIDEIFMSDVLEHFYRVDGLEVLADFSEVLKPGGKATIVTPDLERLITSQNLTLQRKTELIRGAQGQEGPTESAELMRAWAAHPKLFSHPYTWTERELRNVLVSLGFTNVCVTWREDWEMVVTSEKMTKSTYCTNCKAYHTNNEPCLPER